LNQKRTRRASSKKRAARVIGADIAKTVHKENIATVTDVLLYCVHKFPEKPYYDKPY